MNPIKALLGYAKEAYQGVVPIHLRTFGETLLGRRDPLTEADMSVDERRRMITSLAEYQGMQEDFHPAEAVPQKRPDGSLFIPKASTYIGDPDIKSTFGKGGYRIKPDGTSVFTDNYDFHPSKKGNYGGSEFSNEWREKPSRIGAIGHLIKAALQGIDDPGDELADIALGGASRKTTVRFSKEETQRYHKELERFKKHIDMMRSHYDDD